jgi:AcrR family transcriptional regulator
VARTHEFRPGRRPGTSHSAEAILKQARELFAWRGYAKTSLRAVADAAKVDPALINYFFGSKAGLFQAAIDIPISLDMPAMVEFRSSKLPPAERTARFFFSLWDDPSVAQALSAMILEAGINSLAGKALRRFMFAYVGGPVVRELSCDHPETRLRMAVGLMGSVALQRRFDSSSTLTALSVDQVVKLVAPSVLHILTSPLPDDLPSEPGLSKAPSAGNSPTPVPTLSRDNSPTQVPTPTRDSSWAPSWAVPWEPSWEPNLESGLEPRTDLRGGPLEGETT